MNIGIIGASGYGGVELHRFLERHPHAGKCILYTSSEEKPIYSDLYPHLTDINQEVLQNQQNLEETDVLFIAAPSGVSAAMTPEIVIKHPNMQIIDLSGDLRLKNSEDYKKWYGKEPASQEVLVKAVYGLADLNKESIKEAQIIANPGCYPTAALLGLAPLFHSRDIADLGSVIIDAKSGVSGAGKKAVQSSLFSEMNENFRTYKIAEHQHTPEIEQFLGSWAEDEVKITFTPHLVPMTRGIMATAYIQLKKEIGTDELLELYREFYRSSPFVRIRKEGSYPSTKEVYGSNYCDIGLKADPRTGRLVVVSVIDNLVKGAAGQAVHNFNLMNGFEETSGLEAAPIYP
ncbi:N-acetyl-gamma-glutamyl-phosphate reductase [Metabacillus sp. GX 13764]|uniref:N-acetyl-gamma-glutamyl-phosphate reductase n=1 Tax=Metabacillus kandeliae TaxID=2900151 RepID=UPI001E533666|nr:N-acetyl-gamma-glutamyl-phosphate reductase [Metabacillus kandeliae]MCD7034948.1 N-acetyl-gamma-glutamyl-phosphate reductase [Metabacillus kandeliae]